jgi:hypothetical protein
MTYYDFKILIKSNYIHVPVLATAIIQGSPIL